VCLAPPRFPARDNLEMQCTSVLCPIGWLVALLFLAAEGLCRLRVECSLGPAQPPSRRVACAPSFAPSLCCASHGR